MTLPSRIRIGTRGSPLALKQAHLTHRLLTDAVPELSAPGVITTIPIETSGDKFLGGPLYEVGGKGLFTKELEEALLSDKIDIAVHSLKDVAAVLPPGLLLGAYLEREDPRDALICKNACCITELPRGAIVGTSSVRRVAFLKALRPDLSILPLRGNVGTRLAKLEKGEAQATLLAMAGLNRLGNRLDYAYPIPVEEMLPSAGQGIIAIECRENDSAMREILEKITHRTSAICAMAERAMLAMLDGSCRTPIAGLAEIRGSQLHMRGMVAKLDGSFAVRHEMTGAPGEAEQVGKAMAEYLLSNGGRECLIQS